VGGARWVQEEILATHEASDLKVYAVWFSMVRGDKRRAFQPEVLTDSRVTHLWDEERHVGRWFARNLDIENCNDIAWDAFFVFEPDATWDGKPEPIVESGVPILAKQENLREAIEPLLN
jgi:hypothetical protein